MAMKSNGALSTALTQNRRAMWRNSVSSSCAPASGTNAMPHFGHDPGFGLRISGCIGHVYSVVADATGITGISAIPHFGQEPGAFCTISGCIGQVYCAPAFGGGAGAGFVPTYCSGSALKACAQCCEQK